MRRFALSDIHGCAATFRALVARLNLQVEDELFLLGDFIDRGPDSKAVLDHIFQLRQSGLQVHCLRGNHEQLLLNALEFKTERPAFLLNGGQSTLDSFGLARVDQIPSIYLDFFQSLPFYLETPGFILVHAGLYFGTENPFENQAEMMWIRQWYPEINYRWLENRIILHGHTPLPKADIDQQLQTLSENKFLDIDAGCVYTHIPGMGQLAAFDLDKRRLFYEYNQDLAYPPFPQRP